MKVSQWAEIHRLREEESLSNRAIARSLKCSRKTVKRALALREPPWQASPARGSVLDPYLSTIDAWIEKDSDLSAIRVLEEIRKDGYSGKITLVERYLKKTRPSKGRVYVEAVYDPAEAMQLDWGSCGSVAVGESRRKVSVLVAVLCFSRLIYIEFTLSQKKEVFYRCTRNALAFFEAAPGGPSSTT